MKIEKATAIAISIPLRKPFTIAVGALTHSTQVLVKLIDDQGRVGWGEGSTFLEVYGYDQVSLYRALADHLLPGIVGLDPREAGVINQCMEKIMPHNLMAKAAVDLACLDLCGKALNQPLHVMIGGKRMDKVPMVGVVDMVEPDKAGPMALQLVEKGFDFIKIKIGKHVTQDVKRVEAVKKAVGDKIKLRVDGNAGYSRTQASEVFTRMDGLGLDWIEQPLPDWDLEGHAKLANELKTPIALDESVYDAHDAHQCLSLGAGQVVNIKIVKCGGIRASQKIATVAEAAGASYFLGGNLDLSPSISGAIQFYSTTEGIAPGAEVLGSTDFYIDDVVEDPLTVKNGYLELPTGPGLGVTIDEKKVEHYRLDK